MNNKRPQYTKSKFKMFSSCFIFYDNTGTPSLRLWFPNMPLLVLWLNIDFSIQAEAALNLGSCPIPWAKQMPWSGVEQQWLALPPALLLPGGRGREHVQLCQFAQQWRCSPRAQSQEEEEKICSPCTPPGAKHRTVEQKTIERNFVIYS